jgi:hypothetical protein
MSIYRKPDLGRSGATSVPASDADLEFEKVPYPDDLPRSLEEKWDDCVRMAQILDWSVNLTPGPNGEIPDVIAELTPNYEAPKVYYGHPYANAERQVFIGWEGGPAEWTLALTSGESLYSYEGWGHSEMGPWLAARWSIFDAKWYCEPATGWALFVGER